MGAVQIEMSKSPSPVLQHKANMTCQHPKFESSKESYTTDAANRADPNDELDLNLDPLACTSNTYQI
jgi:hypothetical protein